MATNFFSLDRFASVRCDSKVPLRPAPGASLLPGVETSAAGLSGKVAFRSFCGIVFSVLVRLSMC